MTLKRFGTILALLLTLTLFSYTQDTTQDPKPPQEQPNPPREASPPPQAPEAKPPQGQEEEKPPKQQAKPKSQKNETQETPQPDKEQQKPAHGQQGAAPQQGMPAQKGTRAQGTAGQQGTARPAGKGGHIPDPQFKANFGQQHTFAVNRVITTTTIVPNQTQFVFAGYTFVFLDPWPADWLFTDDCYIDFIDDEYFLVDVLHPGVRVALFVVV